VTTTYSTEVLAQTRTAELRREACAARLAVLVACCQPSAVARNTRRAMTAVARLRASLGRDRCTHVACCAA
jgi:hypothetical protein